MNTYLLYNGEIVNSKKLLITADNRGLKYGDGLFETMCFKKGEIALAIYHFERLFAGLLLLKFDIPSYFTPSYFTNQILELCNKNKHTMARIRLTVFRGGGGLYDVQNHFPNCIIQSWSLPKTVTDLNENGMVIGIYDGATKNMDSFSNVKSNNCLPYLMAALYAKEQHWNDALILNSAGRICETTIANLFIVKNNTVFTPALTEGCVAGVYRKFLIAKLPTTGIKLQETAITINDVETADEVFISNAIKGIKWVKSNGGVNYKNELTSVIYKEIIKKHF